MPWVRFDDGFPEHPKVLAAGPLGMALQVAAVCYCNRALTDGFVHRSKAPILLDLDGLADWRDVVAALEKAGMWRPVTEPQPGWLIHDYLDFQGSRSKVLADRTEARERMRRNRSQDVQANNGRTPPEVRDGFDGSSKTPTPTPQRTEVPSELPVSRARAKRAVALPDTWEPNGGHRRIAAERRLDIALEVDRMRDWAKANGAVKKDWDATFRNWLRNDRRTPASRPGRDPGYAPGDLSAAAEILRQQGR
jgi:hypothetical protein